MSSGKSEALAIIFNCAEKYEKNLKNKNLLFVCMDRNKKLSYMEVEFNASNFLHLTGVKLTDEFKNDFKGVERFAKVFYKKCLVKRLRIKDFDFSDDGTTQLKLTVLPMLMEENLSANSIGDYDVFKPRLYTEKTAGNIKGCMGFVFDENAKKLIPNTILNEDIRNISSNQKRIILTYQKNKGKKEYSKIIYKAKKIDWSSICFSKEYEYLPKPTNE